MNPYESFEPGGLIPVLILGGLLIAFLLGAVRKRRTVQAIQRERLVAAEERLRKETERQVWSLTSRIDDRRRQLQVYEAHGSTEAVNRLRMEIAQLEQDLERVQLKGKGSARYF